MYLTGLLKIVFVKNVKGIAKKDSNATERAPIEKKRLVCSEQSLATIGSKSSVDISTSFATVGSLVSSYSLQNADTSYSHYAFDVSRNV